MAGEIDPSKLASGIIEICESYVDEIQEVVEREVDKAATRAAEILKTTSPRDEDHTGTHYADSWTKSKKRTNGEVVATVRNKQGGLTGLLEDGHQLRQGGRSPAIPHIRPAAEEASKEFEQNVEKGVESVGS